MIVSDLPCAFPSSPMLAPLPLRSSRSITIDCSAKSPKLLSRPASENDFDFDVERDFEELCCIERSGDLRGHRDAVNGAPRHNTLNGKRYPHRLPPHNTSSSHNPATHSHSPTPPPSVATTGTSHHTTPSHNARVSLSPLSVPPSLSLPLSASDSLCSWRDLELRPLPTLPAISPPAGIAIEDREEEELEQRESEREGERDELDELFDSYGCASPLTTTSSLDSADHHTKYTHNNNSSNSNNSNNNNSSNSNNNALFPSSRPHSHASRCSYTQRDTHAQQGHTQGQQQRELVRIPSLSAFFREHECRSVPSSPTPSRPGSARSVSSAASVDSNYSTYSTDSAGVDMVSVASLSLSQCSSRAGSRPGSARTSRASSRFGMRPFRCASPTDRGVVDDPADSLKRKIKKSFSVDVHEMQGIVL